MRIPSWLGGSQPPIKDPLDMLSMALRAHQLEAVRVGDTIQSGTLKFAAKVFDKEPHQGALVVLEFYIYSNRMSVQPIIESYAGFGATREDAVATAFQTFLQCTFHVLIEALDDHRCEAMQATVETWTGSSGEWIAYCGPVFVRSTGAPVIGSRFPDFLTKFEHMASYALRPEAHFIRLFVASAGAELAGCEVLVDNETWVDGEQLLSVHDWTLSEEYNALRANIVLLPAGPARSGQ